MANNKIAGIFVELSATTARLEKDLRKATSLLTGFQKNVSRIGKIITTSFAISLGKDVVRAVSMLGQELARLAERGDAVNDLRENFAKLGGKQSAINQASDSVSGLVSQFDLLQAATRGLAKNLPGVQQNFALIADFGTRFAEATGASPTDTIIRLIDGLAAGSAKLNKQFALGIEKGDTYADVYEKIRVAMEKLAPVGEGVTTSITKLSNALQSKTDEAMAAIDADLGIARAIDEITAAIDRFDGSALVETLRSIIELSTKAIAGLINFASSIDALSATQTVTGALSSMPLIGGAVQGLSSDIERTVQQATIISKIKSQLSKLSTSFQGGELAKNDDLGGLFKGAADAATRAAEEVIKFNAEVEKTLNSLATKSIERELQSALSLGDASKFETELGYLIERTSADLQEKYREALVKGADAAKIGQLIAVELQYVQSEWTEKWIEESKRRATAEAEELKRAFEDSANFFSDVFLDAMRGTLPTLTDLFEQVAAGFAGQLFAAISGIQFNGNFIGLGQSIAGSLLGQGGSGLGLGGQLAGVAGAAGLGYTAATSTAAVHGMGIAGPGLASGAFGSGAGILGTIGPALPYVAAALAVYTVLDKTGVLDGGPTNPDTLARKKVEGFLQDQTGREFTFGPSGRFDNGGFEYFNDLDEKQRETFKGVGEGITAVLEITEAVGPQIGAILAENLGGNIDAARKLVKELGISLDDMIAKVVSAGLEANKSLLEIQSNIQGIEEAYKPGLSGEGNVAGAFENYINSLNQGQDALWALRDIFTEAKEAGAETLTELQSILEQSFPADQVAIFIQAMRDLGISDLSELEQAGDRTLIALGAHIEALGFKFDELREKIAAANAELEKLSSMPDASDISADLDADIPPTAAATDGMNTRSAQFFIDARNAAPGVSEEIERVMRNVVPNIVSESLATNYDVGRRGGAYSGGY